MAGLDGSRASLHGGEAPEVDLEPPLEVHNAVLLLVHVSQLGVAVTGDAGVVEQRAAEIAEALEELVHRFRALPVTPRVEPLALSSDHQVPRNSLTK